MAKGGPDVSDISGYHGNMDVGTESVWSTEVWACGSSGPHTYTIIIIAVRTTLLWEHSDIAILAVINTILVCGNHSKVSAIVIGNRIQLQYFNRVEV